MLAAPAGPALRTITVAGAGPDAQAWFR
jgi:hypothetical protein